MLEYKGYHGRVEFDSDAELFHGEVVDVRDVITFQATTASDLNQAFRDSVDDYLAYCSDLGEEPDRPFSGRLMVRIRPSTHRRLYLEAKERGESLNQLIAEKLERAG